ncbi:hypothetical protein GP486_006378 [Trichoglossum hirsutum]|uniref:Kinesin motor domain-containing protein n=1 Tax=Trichoglossum hirsutum TaxID=265104 RepID=A0A9P8L7F7_9PEZI|nr:hypothetical protein GP486_006378 [Trichoglossum hirsutum]
MSVRVVARIRPLLKAELDRDIVVHGTSSSDGGPNGDIDTIRIPNPRNENEEFSFQFNSVYGVQATQEDIFQNEAESSGVGGQLIRIVAPTINHLFQGFDVTIFAYGVTGTGKTHTMRGGKTLSERGVIPRLLSGIYRRSRKLEKDSQGATSVEVSMSYYEIYNDRVYDLFEAPEKRTAPGLPLREQNGKTFVVGLTERPCASLKEFENLYDQANVNRSTSATKLNAHSSRSHAILCVKVSVTTGEETRVSMASAIDLAGSEDNRRTENGKERLVESASINKSLFVLAQCVEAISKKQARIPYRESKMTRILSLGQNNGLTIMVLNLAPVRSYHLDTLSSLNFANRTKKIEVKEIENEPMFRGPAPIRTLPSVSGPSIQRQPLRPLTTTELTTMKNALASRGGEKSVKAFTVYSDKAGAASRPSNLSNTSSRRRPVDSFSRTADQLPHRPLKNSRTSRSPRKAGWTAGVSKENIEQMVEKKVEEILAARVLNEPSKTPMPAISEEVQRRLELLEQRIEKKDDTKAEGLTYLLMAKQHQVRGEDVSALKMYQLALPYFPDNAKLAHKMHVLEERLRVKREQQKQRTVEISRSQGQELPQFPAIATHIAPAQEQSRKKRSRTFKELEDPSDDEYRLDDDAASDSSFEGRESGFRFKPKSRRAPRPKIRVFRDNDENVDLTVKGGASLTGRPRAASVEEQTPRTRHILNVVNTRDLSQIRLLKGVGAKKAEMIVDCLHLLEAESEYQEDGDDGMLVGSLAELSRMKGVGAKTVENMRSGITL